MFSRSVRLLPLLALLSLSAQSQIQVTSAVITRLPVPNDFCSTPPAETASYEAYVDYYNRAVLGYYGQQGQSASPEQVQRAGYGQAHARADQPLHEVDQPTRPSSPA